MAKEKPGDLREACIAGAMAIIAADGVEKLSLREVARRLGVSHQAPYKHFPDRDHILAEIVSRAFASFARHLDSQETSGDPEADMGRMGQAYLSYAARHPLEYRLMFGTPLPDPQKHPEMMRQARHAFGLLCNGLRRKAHMLGRPADEDAIVLDALFIWSGLHGLASIAASSAVSTLGIEPRLLAEAGPRMLRGFGAALAASPSDADNAGA